jgi:hypothetical protein
MEGWQTNLFLSFFAWMGFLFFFFGGGGGGGGGVVVGEGEEQLSNDPVLLIK